ncbi:phosphatidylinositol-specific phospholipase C/glycerophosphodiester phosphodiesterase family protein [Streptomyces sp. NPDC045431]|uniref:phosphatidylinositol-specific phospholipase C/glycerophosphodiester phosphodiesterase family protein n=1 Tax=Streptomyces sp. NPDC045431 TaxID=3155613 RepID=UPI0033EC29BC
MAPLSRRSAVAAFATLTAAAPLGGVLPAQRAAAAHRAAPVRPLRRAHAHNDYLHQRPLHDALAHGFTSVEADVFLVGGDLLVAHEPWQLDPTRTLRSLYLDPLLARVRAHHGTVYAGYREPVQLLIDIKADGAAAYRALHRQLVPYRRMLSTFVHGTVRPGAVTAVVSGDRAARAPMEAQPVRYAFYDGRLGDLGTAAPASFVPLISAHWNQGFTWQGTGPFPEAERARLHALVTAAHRAGQRVRFWATPDHPGAARDALWTELLAARVDHLNTDDLAGLAAFLRRTDGGGNGKGTGTGAA